MDLYSVVALRFGVSPLQVMDDISYAISTIWKKADKEFLLNVFGNIGSFKNDLPANSDFILRSANYIRKQTGHRI